MERVVICRQIGIDMGHRVPDHASKCKNLHGHRYTIEAFVTAEVTQEPGQERGMVMDFGFLKQAMMDVIDVQFDHTTTLWAKDPQLAHILGPSYGNVYDNAYRSAVAETEWGFGRLNVIQLTPTAENLAKIWFYMLEPEVERMSDGRAILVKLQVWETPNCYVDFQVV